jgi:vanillate O-demethylase monooxygenase subunit
MNGVIAPPFWRENLRANGLPDDQPVDRWQICHFSPPSHVMIEVGVALAGRGGHQAAPEHKVSSIVVDFITPETETSMWYFWGMARNFRVADSALTDQIRQGQGQVFSEDTAVLEAVFAKNLGLEVSAETRSRALGRALRSVEALPEDASKALLPRESSSGDPA